MVVEEVRDLLKDLVLLLPPCLTWCRAAADEEGASPCVHAGVWYCRRLRRLARRACEILPKLDAELLGGERNG